MDPANTNANEEQRRQQMRPLAWLCAGFMVSIWMLVVAVCASGAFRARADDLEFQRHGVEAVALVRSLSETPGRGGGLYAEYTYHPIGSVELQGKAQITLDQFQRIRAGLNHIRIVYDQRDPSLSRANFDHLARADTHSEQFRDLAIFAVLGLAFIACAVSKLRPLL